MQCQLKAVVRLLKWNIFTILLRDKVSKQAKR